MRGLKFQGNESKASIWSARSSASLRCRFSIGEDDFTTMKKEGTLEQSMMDALLNDRVDAVKVLIENGFTMQTFLTIARLEELYNTRLGPTNTLRHLVQDTKKKSVSSRYRYTMLDIGGVIEHLMEGAYRSGYCRKQFKQKYHAIKRNSVAGNIGRLVTTMPMIMDTTGAQELFPHPYHDLLIWAVILKRHDMAMYIWRQGDEAMAKALIAVKLNKAMAAEADRYDAEVDISDGLRSNAKSFMKLSLELLEHCSKMDDACTQHLLTYELKNFSNQTCMGLAVSGNHRKFVAHRCCQVLLNDMWMGGLRTRKNSSLKVILGILFPPCIPLLEYKTKKELKLMPQTLEEHLYELHAQGLHERNMSVGEDLNTGNINEGFNAEDNTETSFQATPSSSSIPTSPGFSNSPSFHIGHRVLGANESAATDVSGLTDNSNGFQFPVKKKENQLRLDKKIYEFYNAPITKFWMYAMTYIMFLICYSYVVLVRTYPEPKWQEWAVMVYVATTALDKLRSIIASEPVSVTKKLNLYFSQKWNIWDTMMLTNFALAVTLRFIPSTLRDARILYTINIVFWYPRILQIISVNKYLGPYIKIMAKLFIDMCYFTTIMVIVVITFGIVRQSIHFQHEEPSWKIVRNVFFYPYWMIYGELFAHEIDTCYDENNHPDGCTYGSWVGPAFMCVYLLLIYVLLVNMLIARFNATFIANNSYVKEIWKFQLYMRVVRYKMCPILPAPLVLFSHIFLSVRFLIRRCKGTNAKFENGLKLFLSRKDAKHLHEFESEAVEDYFRQTDMNFRSSQEERVRVINERTEMLNLGMDGITQKGQCMKLTLQTANQRMSHLEEISNRTSETLLALKNLLDLGVKSIGANGFASCVSGIEQSLALDSTSDCNSNNNNEKVENDDDSASARKSDSSAADTCGDISLNKSIDHTGSDVHSDVSPATEGRTELSIHVYDTAKDKETESDTKNASSSSENDKHTLKTEAVRVRRVSA
ncbi:transient receptor potential cation channel subfamily M member 1-like isoform X2 [Mizuhopecten yessoensis]|uniref:transient receptor potential cation channel subfamily M member 1-like isoform X2 n=1 Tax=Mizuhopecten yessoensis TaxID=6573 RepID=UPI000B45C03E|nr:transient receptor potential cation channel subfamily M member 1-like isoform X2 [Mizuhopecten yessoensis]